MQNISLRQEPLLEVRQQQKLLMTTAMKQGFSCYATAYIRTF